MHIEPYLFFNGRCEEAVEFYKKALSAEVTMLMRFKESPEPPQPGMVPPGSENKIMHVSFRIGDTTVMASDGRCTGQTDFHGFSLSLTVANEAEAERKFAANFLVAAFRHGGGSLWGGMDGHRRALKWSQCIRESNLNT